MMHHLLRGAEPQVRPVVIRRENTVSGSSPTQTHRPASPRLRALGRAAANRRFMRPGHDRSCTTAKEIFAAEPRATSRPRRIVGDVSPSALVALAFALGLAKISCHH